MRSITGGNITDRDRLLLYGIGEFYNEMSLFIEETEKKAEELKRVKGRRK